MKNLYTIYFRIEEICLSLPVDGIVSVVLYIYQSIQWVVVHGSHVFCSSAIHNFTRLYYVTVFFITLQTTDLKYYKESDEFENLVIQRHGGVQHILQEGIL